MQLLKPSWVTHDGKPIFSVDIHPKGRRFATGGQGIDSGRIVIWNLKPVLSEEAECDASEPKMLCQMDNHLACVNIVRWSCAGHLLASGGDDKLVMIWKLTGESSNAIFGSNGKVNVETWKCVATLNSHTGDVLDLAWAHHDGWLASCSVDNNVIVWNARKFPEKLALLRGHTGLVKGVAWDPVGKYLASQSDDKTVRIWRTVDWSQQELISEPFEECSGTTHVLRLSWSPDGQYLVSAHAMNGGGPTAQIIEREGWKQDKDFVGHRKAVTCVRFNSNVLQKSFPGSPKMQQYCCCAIGARDRSLSVWLTSLKRPLVVIHDLFTSSVLDLSWSSSGLHLLACSWDGTVACIEFTPEEIGKPLSNIDKLALYERLYGKNFKNHHHNFIKNQIVENPDMLTVMEDFLNRELFPKSSNDINTVVRNEEQIQVIKPKLKPKTDHVPTNKQIEVRLPDGKRRITPMFLTSEASNNNKCAISLPEALSSSSPTKSKIVVEQIEETSKNVFNQTPIKPPTIVKQRQEIQTNKIPGISLKAVLNRDESDEESMVHIINILDPLKTTPGGNITKIFQNLKISITNECYLITNGSLSKVQIYNESDDGIPFWETYLGSSICCVAANQKFLIICCDNFCLNCYEISSGAKTLPPLMLDDSIVSIQLSTDSHCLVLTSSGFLYMWNIEIRKSILNKISLKCLLSKTVTVSNCLLTKSNLPLIILSDGRSFIYNLSLCTWVLLTMPDDPINRVGLGLIFNGPENLPLATLQKVSAHCETITETLPSGVTLSFLENQMISSLVLESPVEFKYWLFATIEHLLEKGPESRLRSILDDLLGPVHQYSLKENERTILGITKRSLLDEALVIIGNKVAWQRLHREYVDQITYLRKE